MPNPFAAQEIWDSLGGFETSNELWPSLSEFSSEVNQLNTLSGPAVGTSAFEVGWHVRGAIDKWMGLPQGLSPEATSERFCGRAEQYHEYLFPPGRLFGRTPNPEVPSSNEPSTPGWTYVAYGNGCTGTIVGEYQEKPLETCHGSTTLPPVWAGWAELIEVFGLCEEGFLGKHPGEKVNEIAALRTQPFHFSPPEDYGSQTAAYVIEEVEPSPVPNSEAIEKALKAMLENSENETLSKWLRNLTTGEGPNPTQVPSPSEELGPGNPNDPNHPPFCKGDPVNCATGNLSETQTDLAVGGRGVGLDLTRTYNSQAAAGGEHGPFGYGWSSTFGDHLVISVPAKTVTVDQANGSTVLFKGNPEAPGELTPSNWGESKLVVNSDKTFSYTLPSQQTFHFSSSGRLLSESDRDGNATTLTYSEAGHLETITDPVGRTIKLKYNGEGLVESTEDPMKHVVKYTYEGGNLKSVTQPGETGLRWQFKYDSSHELTTMTDGRGGKTTNEYSSAHKDISQTDPAGRTLSFEYLGETEPLLTIITNHATGAVTKESFNAAHELTSIIRGYGTSAEVSETFSYDGATALVSRTDGDAHSTTYTYDGVGDRTSELDANGNETKWTYDSTHDVETITTPKGEVTTIKREAHGNPETISRPAPGSTTQTTKYIYSADGELESMEDPLKRVWKYGYDGKGDRTSETDPLTNKRTWEYNENSQETATVSPRGNAEGAEASKFTTKIERDAQGRPLKVTDPLGHTTKYTYDGDGNVETMIDGNSHKTKYTYSADNEPTKVEAPNKTVTETEYDGAGQVVKQTDGNKHVTEYKRNALEQVTEVIDPLKHKTVKEYDRAGNLESLTDPKGRTTTYTYDPANRLVEVSYSDETTPTVKYEYDKDGDRTSMTDGTGTTKYEYDQLDRMTESENGHKEKTKYEYNLGNLQAKVTYPNTKAVERAYDKDGRLEKITDWSSNVTKFTYNADSDSKRPSSQQPPKTKTRTSTTTRTR